MLVRKESSEKLLSFLQKIDSDFNPPLSFKVNLPDYVLKIQEKAELLIESHEKEICGLLVLYCNDTDHSQAYVALLGVANEWRGQGIARKLMQEAIRIVQESGFSTLSLHSNTPVAIRLYEKLGFRIVENGERVYMELSITKNEI